MILFGRTFHAGHAILALLLLVVLLAGVRLLRTLATPFPPPPPAALPFLADPQALAGRDIFFPVTTEELPVTALPFSLHGTRLDEATGRGSAIIATGDGEQNVYAIGDSLGPDTSLAAIAPDHVVLSFRGRHETLWLDEGGDEVERIPPSYTTPDTDLPESDLPPASAAAAGLPPIPTGDAAAVPVAPGSTFSPASGPASGPRKNAP